MKFLTGTFTLFFSLAWFCCSTTIGQNVMTPELLWSLRRVSGLGISTDGSSVIYSVSRYDIKSNERTTEHYSIPLIGGDARKIESADTFLEDTKVNQDNNLELIHKKVKLLNTLGKDLYPDLKMSDVYIYDDLMMRHWDTWSDGSYRHVFIKDLKDGSEIDIMSGQPYHCPTMPFGGTEDYIWNPDGTEVIYVSKKKKGHAYTTSTNTDLFAYNLKDKTTTNLTSGFEGYDTHPAFSANGVLAWLSMKTDGYESDKNDIVVHFEGNNYNLTKDWDGTVSGFLWGADGTNIYFTAPVDGTKQLFEVNFPGRSRQMPKIKQITEGVFDVTGIIGQSGDQLVVSRTDMNHATELYMVRLDNGKMTRLTHVNDEIYDRIKLSKIEKRLIETTDGKEMVSWVIYPPGFDPTKKYPTLLYCQGGPQGALSQFYSYRWNFQLMAANGYIVVAPNRRGMPGHGVEWNEQISKDYGGQNMEDYLSAIDALSQEPFVDNSRLGAVGASYGGYSVFFLAGIHEGRFKSFIAHDGLFNLRSFYGTTEEWFFPNYDLGGPYWDVENDDAQRAYSEFNPINNVVNWDTPILIFQGGKDFRVPIGQGIEAFQAAQGLGIKSRFVYLPDENHWVLSPQNGIVWQREFFRWLEETLK